MEEGLKPLQRVVPIDSPDIRRHPKNPRRGNISAIKDSIKVNGYYPTIFIQDSSGYILKGNHTWQALQELYAAGFEKYREVMINVLECTDEQALRIIIADNAASDYGTYSNEATYEILEELSHTDLGLGGTLWGNEDLDNLAFVLNKNPVVTAEEIDAPTEEEVKERLEEGAKAEGADGADLLQHESFLYLFPAEPDFDIPFLDLSMQVEKVELPFMIYSMQRTAKALPRGEVATLAFYAEDVTFEKFWKNPNLVVEYRVKNAVEINFSTDGQAPRAYNLWQIYRKRWLARYWQSKGIRTMVDVCVHRSAWNDMLLGVPEGWRSYCNRGNVFTNAEETRKEYLDNFALCAEKAGTDDIVYMIYGGGNVVKELCSEQKWVWVPDEKTLMHGKEREALAAQERALVSA